ncbi:MAG TPA: HD domain-containing phosphohydrolase [Nitrospinota bacterium]|nr:HD domain-containing phosphohydrolase [Nitrospinota bacterium]
MKRVILTTIMISISFFSKSFQSMKDCITNFISVPLKSLERGEASTKNVNELNELIKSFNKITTRLEEEIKELEFSNNHMKRVLSEIAMTMNFPQDTDNMLDTILNIAVKALDAKKGLLIIKNKNHSGLVIKSAIGYDKGLIGKTKIRFGEGIVGWVVENGKPVILPEGDKDNRFEKISHLELENQSILCVPLIHSRKIMGGISISNKICGKKFSDEDIIILNNLAVQTAVALENAMLREKIESTYFETISALALAVESKDKYTRGHSIRVGRIAKTIAEKMDVAKKEIEDIEHAATLHDIGKIGIVDNILLNKGKLTPLEFDVIKRHPEIGENIIKPVASLSQICPIVRHHHERVDGNGYPDHLSEKEIPRASRILIVADAFDAMTSDRPYRKAMGFEEAIKELDRNAGYQFDRDVVNNFIECFEKENFLVERVHQYH